MKKLSKYYSLFEDLSSGLFLLTGLCLMFYEVVLRYVFNSPTTWINGISTILVVWGILIGWSVALRDNHHISVDLLYELLPSGLRKMVDFIANIVGALFCMFFTYNGIILVQHIYLSGQIAIDTLVPIWIYYLVIPISGLMFMIRFVERIVNIIRFGSPVNPAGEEANEDIHAF